MDNNKLPDGWGDPTKASEFSETSIDADVSGSEQESDDNPLLNQKEETVDPTGNLKKSFTGIMALAVALVALVIVGLFGFYLLNDYSAGGKGDSTNNGNHLSSDSTNSTNEDGKSSNNSSDNSSDSTSSPSNTEPTTTKTELVEVPDLIGLKFEVAFSPDSAIEKDFQIEIEKEEYSDTYEEGHIISQDISPGETLQRGAIIKVVVSKGKPIIKLPDVVGMPVDMAKATLRAAGYMNIITVNSYDNSVEVGTVTGMDPKGNSSVDTSTQIVLHVVA